MQRVLDDMHTVVSRIGVTDILDLVPCSNHDTHGFSLSDDGDEDGLTAMFTVHAKQPVATTHSGENDGFNDGGHSGNGVLVAVLADVVVVRHDAKSTTAAWRMKRGDETEARRKAVSELCLRRIL